MRSSMLICTVALAVLSSCSYFKKKDEIGPAPVIRYMNLKAAYDFVLNRNRDAIEVKKKVDERMARLKEVERELDRPATDHVSLLDEYRTVTAELFALRGKSKYYKGQILNVIDRALKNVAGRLKVDFIYNIGDELMYAKKEYDVTEDVIREVVRLEERRAPESR
ncbi:MAG: OmpH family outer membrane protein [Spirochaetes bacterium]|nr:OmpH family outer membrane protein [Spirochaetota bacterium]